MISSQQIKSILINLLAMGLLVCTFIAVQSMSNEPEQSAEGRLSEYYGTGGGGGGGVYPGDMYPGERPPLYPGDEKWDGLYVIPYDTYPVAPTLPDVSGLSTDGVNIFGVTNYKPYLGDTPLIVGKWNPTNFWGRIAPGENGYLVGSAVLTQYHNNNLYVGGSLSKAGSVDINNIAYWDGTIWNNMGGGVWYDLGKAKVEDIAFSGNDVYVVGSFNRAGNVSVNNIARWDGANWHDVGGGVYGTILAVSVSGSNVYVGGGFTSTSGLQDVNYVARWDGQQWNALGSGLSYWVEDVAVQGNDVYVAGVFTTAGGQPAKRVARWNGSQWNSLGDLVGTFHTLEAAPEGVYVGGSFSLQFTTYPAGGLMLWNGVNWENLGSALSFGGNVYDILAKDDQIFIGGYFQYAGNDKSNSFAVWNKQPIAKNLFVGTNPVAPGSILMLYGRFFPPDRPVELSINNQKISPGLSPVSGVTLAAPIISTNEGDVNVSLATGANAEEGTYNFTLTSGTVSASGQFVLAKGAPVVQSPFQGDKVLFQGTPTYLPAMMR